MAMNNEGDPSLEDISMPLKNIFLWINKAIAYMLEQPYCNSVRKVYIKSEQELAYY